MSEFTKAIVHIEQQVKIYRNASPDDGETLVKVLQQISPTLVYLEKERALFHAKWNETIHSYILGGDPVNRAENKANIEVPELYMLRRFMDSAYKCQEAIRTQISWLKSQLNNNI